MLPGKLCCIMPDEQVKDDCAAVTVDLTERSDCAAHSAVHNPVLCMLFEMMKTALTYLPSPSSVMGLEKEQSPGIWKQEK